MALALRNCILYVLEIMKLVFCNSIFDSLEISPNLFPILRILNGSHRDSIRILQMFVIFF
jgi:hypothetical protein